ncbi:hypothetical protein EVAR_85627_1 [Eumeta japonica]|uniref:Uncharacterized protein n=1 Tax=Eumeta variegata TaxID=151549 RepID=A0A4C1XRH7_EUMVA|nr:hypothetical protein EVAR_85627_1 [Eumeta japonica]
MEKTIQNAQPDGVRALTRRAEPVMNGLYHASFIKNLSSRLLQTTPDVSVLKVAEGIVKLVSNFPRVFRPSLNKQSKLRQFSLKKNEQETLITEFLWPPSSSIIRP